MNVNPRKAEAYLAFAEIYEKNSQHEDAVSVLKTAAGKMAEKS